MFRLVLISALVAIAAGASPKVRPIVPMLDGRIVGGVEAAIIDIPYQISLRSSGRHICGGTIVSATRIVTAAHCTDGSSASRLSIRAGSSSQLSGGQEVQVAEIKQNPQYNRTTIDYDVSVLILSRPLTFGFGVQPATLHDIDHSLATGVYATVSGWGTTTSGGSSPVTLRIADIPKVSDAYCQNAYGSITPRMVCHGFEQGGRDFCQGDSGGPLVLRTLYYVLVGVVSWGAGCAAPRYPGVYARVANRELHNYITQNM